MRKYKYLQHASGIHFEITGLAFENCKNQGEIKQLLQSFLFMICFEYNKY